MDTVFEILIVEQEAEYAAQAAEAAFEELDRLEGEFSRYIPTSEVAQVNRLSAGERLKVGADLLACLELARQVWTDTGGAFDVTVGPLVDCWRQAALSREPGPDELAQARELVGMDLLDIDRAARTVAVRRTGVSLDLGGIGKGYAVDVMAEVLARWKVERALIHGGQSSVRAMGAPPGRAGWPLSIRDPQDESQELLAIGLNDLSLGASGTGQRGRHIIDPRGLSPISAPFAETGDCPRFSRVETQHPQEYLGVAPTMLGCWVIAPTAAEADAVSTAGFVGGATTLQLYCGQRVETAGILLPSSAQGRSLVRYGSWKELTQR